MRQSNSKTDLRYMEPYEERNQEFDQDFQSKECIKLQPVETSQNIYEYTLQSLQVDESMKQQESIAYPPLQMPQPAEGLSKLDTFSPTDCNAIVPQLRQTSIATSNDFELKYTVEYEDTEHETEDEPDNLADTSQRKIEIGVAMQSFGGQKEQDLRFRVGEKILIEGRYKGSDWWFGSIGSRKGWFPSYCVRLEQHYL